MIMGECVPGVPVCSYSGRDNSRLLVGPVQPERASGQPWRPCAGASSKVLVLAELVCFLICEVLIPALLTTQAV